MWLENSGTVLMMMLRSDGGELSERKRASMDREWAERWNYNDNTSTKCMYNYKVKRWELGKAPRTTRQPKEAAAAATATAMAEASASASRQCHNNTRVCTYYFSFALSLLWQTESSKNDGNKQQEQVQTNTHTLALPKKRAKKKRKGIPIVR